MDNIFSMGNIEIILLTIAGGLAGGLISFMSVAYGQFEKIPSVEEVKDKIKNEKRITFLILRIIFALLTSFIFSLWFLDDAKAGVISPSKFTFYLCIISVSSTILLDVSNGFKKVFNKWLQ